MPEVGIVVPVYNGMPFLPETIASIERQTLHDWRCVLVDDGSSDDSPAVCAEAATRDPRFVLIQQSNSGISAARNTGARLLDDCSYWTFMDGDDVWHPTALERLRDAASVPDRIGAHGIAETIDSCGAVLPGFSDYMRSRSRPGKRDFRPLTPDEPTDLSTALFVNRVYPPGVMLVRREAYQAAGPWNTAYFAVQDWDMLLRLLQQGPISFIDEAIVGYRRHGKNVSGNRERNVAETRLLHVATFEHMQSQISKKTLTSWWRQWERCKLREARASLPAPAAMARLVAHGWRFLRGWPSTGAL